MKKTKTITTNTDKYIIILIKHDKDYELYAICLENNRWSDIRDVNGIIDYDYKSLPLLIKDHNEINKRLNLDREAGEWDENNNLNCFKDILYKIITFPKCDTGEPLPQDSI